uniref:Uncharacterized protein n=1 Tax=Geobacter sp. (strain M21) TaxID=443144 RepID=C6E6T8_GEOSM
MLRLNLCFKECSVTQAELVKATGYSKALVSRALSKGELPVDLERFMGAAILFVDEHPTVSAWLRERGLDAESLFDQVDNEGELVSQFGLESRTDIDLEKMLLSVVGRAATAGPSWKDTLCVTRCALYLIEQLRELPIGMDTLGEIEVGAGRLLLQEAAI